MLPVSSLIPSKINPTETNYPKSLTILLNTRIRGYPKLKYEPSMSIPGTRSETVYFDPLVKLNNSVAGSIPKGYPPSELYTQFFDKGAFDSLISRTLSTSFFGQGKRTIEQATQDGYVDDNIKVTLNQLFKSGNFFYIKGQPFTINGYDWNYGDWKIGTKNIERRFEMSGSTFGQGINTMLELQLSNQEDTLANEELNNFKSTHPEFVMRGKVNPRYSKFEDNELLLTGVASGVSSKTAAAALANPDVTINPEKQAELPVAIKQLIATELVFDAAINSDPDTPSMAGDPVSKSILDALNVIYLEEKDKNPELVKLHDDFIESFKKYQLATERFKTSAGLLDNASANFSELEDARRDLIKNNDEIVNQLKSMDFTQIIRKMNYIINLLKEEQPSIPPGPKLHSVGEILKNIAGLKSSINSLIKAQETQLNNDTKDPSLLLQNQVDELTQLKNSQANINRLDNLLNIINSLFENQELDLATKLSLQMELQLLTKLVQEQSKLHFQLIDKFKNTNYSFITSQNKSDSVLKIKGKYDTLVDGFIKMIEKYKRDGLNYKSIMLDQDETVKNRMLDDIKRLMITKKEYISAYKASLLAFLDKINSQQRYIAAFCVYIKLLANIQEKNMDKMKKKNKNEDALELLKLIISVELLNFDYSSYFTLLSDKTYKKRLQDFEGNIKAIIIKLDNELDEPYNAKESFEKYFELPTLLMVEKNQLDCYNIKMLMFDIENEEVLWRHLSENTDKLFERVKMLALNSVGKTYLLYKKYTDLYTEAERSAFLTRYNAGKVPVQKMSLLSFRSSTTKSDAKQREEYENLRNSQVISYTYITLYARLSAITLARKLAFKTQNKNIINATRNYNTSLKKYYGLIKTNIAALNGNIPESLFWETRNLQNVSIVDALIKKVETELNQSIYDKTYLEDEINELNFKYKDELDLFIPYISKMGIFKYCVEITSPENLNQSLATTNEEARMFFFKNLFKDDEMSEICSDQVSLLSFEYFLRVKDKETSEPFYLKVFDYASKWGVYRYNYLDAREKPGSILEAFVTALNGQLITNQQTTLNKYARVGKDYKDWKFTVSGIRTAISDYIRQPGNEYYFNYYKGKALNFCRYGIMFFVSIPKTTEFEIKLKQDMFDYLSLEWENIKFMFKNRDLKRILGDNLFKQSLPVDINSFEPLIYDDVAAVCNSIEGFSETRALLKEQIYFGDKVILTALERIFKIKTVVVDSYQKGIRIGSDVSFSVDSKGEIKKGYVKKVKYSTSSSNVKDYVDSQIKDGYYVYQKDFVLIKQKLELNIFKQALFQRYQEIVEMENRRPSGFKITLEQFGQLINSIDQLLNMLDIMDIPFDNALYNKVMKQIFEIPNGVNDLEKIPAPGKDTGLTELVKLFNGYDKKKGFLQQAIEYYPNFLIETYGELPQQYNVPCPRIYASSFVEEPYYSIAPLIYGENYHSTTAFKFESCMFMLYNNTLELYSNIFSFYENKFIYRFNELPVFLNMLIFNSFSKFFPETKNQLIYFFKNLDPSYIKIQQEYRTQYDNLSKLRRVSPPIDVPPPETKGAVRRSPRERKNIDLKKPYTVTRGGAPIDSRYVSSNRGNSAFSSNRDSRLSYYVIIDLDLYPGKEGIPMAQKAVLACQNRYEKIRQAWAKLFGLVYRPNELYVTGFTAPSSLKNKGREGRDNYRSTRRRRDREYERTPRNRSERDRYREREA